MNFGTILGIIRRRWPLASRFNKQPTLAGNNLTLYGGRNGYRLKKDGAEWFFVDYNANRYCRGTLDELMDASGYSEEMAICEARIGRLVDKILASRPPRHAILQFATRCFGEKRKDNRIYFVDKYFGRILHWDRCVVTYDATRVDAALRYATITRIIAALPSPIADEISFYIK